MTGSPLPDSSAAPGPGDASFEAAGDGEAVEPDRSAPGLLPRRSRMTNPSSGSPGTKASVGATKRVDGAYGTERSIGPKQAQLVEGR